MKKISGIIFLCLLLCSLSFLGSSQSLKWTTKSKAAAKLATSASRHMMNAEFERAYPELSEAVSLDPNFSMALALMSNLSRGETRKAYAERARQSVGNKTEGEKLFISLLNEKNTEKENSETWGKLHQMFPDDAYVGDIYVQTRPTAAEKFTAAQEYIKKFPEQPAMYNTIGYYYMLDKKDNALAKQNFEKYISLYPDGSNPYDSMGEFYMTTGDMTNAEKYYRMSLEKYPYTTSSINAVQKLTDAKKTPAASN